MQSELDICVKDTIFDPGVPKTEAKVRVRKKKGRNHYKVWIYLEGNDLPYVDTVTYTLHQTFENPVKRVHRSPSNPNCKILIWTWGTFLVKATIVDKQGRTYAVSHQLTYDKEFPTDKNRYVYEEDEAPDAGSRPRLVR